MKIRYFAWVREKVGVEEETLELPADVTTVKDLIAHLKTLDDNHALALADEEVIRVALDQMHVEPHEPLGNTQEVALFPPMTGG
ncbi:molybdopterin synthase subunit MoaD [Roseibium hamelinense]|uniref:Molybdopterin synthase subunit MoaD n=1 Tax=Roseibium hamelinense TaxID=150831 RepID=A0A562SYA3_9HYPH|nr:molybdopterin converting factor subunit 1 [Roseibium hamelinense]MTI43645.1 molybdopterin converting factor subunit 1 [Roseibium hamelinense]TWI86163.1 molybdopterin synthase subunit MoaD [Roseibium hamelinense]